jgi:hypothetical protein
MAQKKSDPHEFVFEIDLAIRTQVYPETRIESTPGPDKGRWASLERRLRALLEPSTCLRWQGAANTSAQASE